MSRGQTLIRQSLWTYTDSDWLESEETTLESEKFFFLLYMFIDFLQFIKYI
jgi:hypothetical protein